jgi:hypothetical protein
MYILADLVSAPVRIPDAEKSNQLDLTLIEELTIANIQMSTRLGRSSQSMRKPLETLSTAAADTWAFA